MCRNEMSFTPQHSISRQECRNKSAMMAQLGDHAVLEILVSNCFVKHTAESHRNGNVVIMPQENARKSQLLIHEQYNERTANREQYNSTKRRHGSCNCSMMSSIIQEVLLSEQYNTLA
jgi:hypothetical protein